MRRARISSSRKERDALHRDKARESIATRLSPMPMATISSMVRSLPESVTVGRVSIDPSPYFHCRNLKVFFQRS
jgi:hypothetical protein